MGEYATVDGYQVKLGTCEDLMYIRRSELLAMGFVGESGSCPRKSDYLVEGHFYRFPWPHEDKETAKDIAQRNPEPHFLEMLEVPESVREHVHHKQLWHHITGPDAGYQVNVGHPCPAEIETFTGDEGKLCRSGTAGVSDDEKTWVYPVRVKSLANGETETVFACVWCQSWFRFGNAATVAELIEANLPRIEAANNRGDDTHASRLLELYRRIVAGGVKA